MRDVPFNFTFFAPLPPRATTTTSNRGKEKRNEQTLHRARLGETTYQEYKNTARPSCFFQRASLTSLYLPNFLLSSSRLAEEKVDLEASKGRGRCSGNDETLILISLTMKSKRIQARRTHTSRTPLILSRFALLSSRTEFFLASSFLDTFFPSTRDEYISSNLF